MSHFVAYFGNDPERVECALFPARMALYARGGREPNGWGLGFAQAGDVLLQKRPKAEVSEVDFFALARSLRADALIARAGGDDEGRSFRDDSDPFRFRSWLFGSVGTVPGFELAREQVLANIPDFLRRNVRGRSPSEHLFHLFLAFLHDAGLLDSLSAPPTAVAQALQESAALLERAVVASGAAPPRMAIVATDGRRMVALTRGVQAQLLQIDGIHDCPVCREKNELEGHDRRIAHEGLRAVIVEANDDHPTRPGWISFPQGATLTVGPERVAALHPAPSA